MKGRFETWGKDLAHASIWSLPGVKTLAWLACVLVYLFILPAQFSLNDQLVFSGFLLGIALFLRRYYGRFVILTLAGLAFIVSTRYLYWRFSSTITGQDLSLEFLLGLILFAAELYLWLSIALELGETLWPLQQNQSPLPGDQADWPTVDVFIVGHECTPEAIAQTAAAAFALDWPKKKIRVCLLDGAPRAQISDLANALGIVYFPHADPAQSRAACINHAIAIVSGDLLVVLAAGQVPDRNFLKATVGWFAEDAELGLLQTPAHFLAPPASRQSLAICKAAHSGLSAAMIRRSALIKSGGVPPEPVNRHVHSARQLTAHGFKCAYLDCTPVEPSPGQRPATPAIRRVNFPFDERLLAMKRRQSALQTALAFYARVPRIVFFIAPLAYLFAQQQVIQGPLASYAAYALPYLIQLHIVQARGQGNTRFTLPRELRETVLAAYLLLPTMYTLIRTELGRRLAAITHPLAAPQPPVQWSLVLPYVGIFALSVTAITLGLLRVPRLRGEALAFAIFFLLWASYHLMAATAMLAVRLESRHIRRHSEQLRRLPAMIKLASGRSVACVTTNFPETCLEIELPTPIHIEAGLETSLSVFHGQREISLPARAQSQQDQLLLINIGEAALNDYRFFASTVFSRGPDWPKWLPARHADCPLPPAVTRAFASIMRGPVKLATHLAKFIRQARLGQWRRNWKTNP